MSYYRSGNLSSSSVKDKLVTTSKSFTSEFLELGNKVLSLTAADAKIETRKSTVSKVHVANYNSFSTILQWPISLCQQLMWLFSY